MRFLAILILVFLCSCQLRRESDADLKLEHGMEDKTGKKFPAVWGIAKGTPSKLESGTPYGQPLCTGTAISKTVILTAGHCVNDDPPGQKYWLVNHGLLALVDSSNQLIEGVALLNPKARNGETRSDSTQGFVADTALIRFENANFTDTVSFHTSTLKTGQVVEIVGFGYDDTQKLVTRQYGKNKILDIIDANSKDPSGDKIFDFYHSMIWIQLDRKLNVRRRVNAGTVPGDSGGPLLIKGKLAGILYGGTYWDKNATPEYKEQYNDSIYVNLKHPSNVEYFEAARSQGWDVPKI